MSWATDKERSAFVKLIRARDGELRCHWCGELHRRSIDHVVSRSNGGTNDIWNLVASCSSCNGNRGNSDDPGHCAFCAEAHRRYA